MEKIFNQDGTINKAALNEYCERTKRELDELRFQMEGPPPKQDVEARERYIGGLLVILFFIVLTIYTESPEWMLVCFVTLIFS